MFLSSVLGSEVQLASSKVATMAISEETKAAGDLANVVYIFVNNHQEGLIALVLLVASIVTFSGRTLLKPAVFLLGFLPAFFFFASVALDYFCSSVADAACPNIASPLPIGAGLLSFLLGIIAGTLVLRLLFSLATFFICGASGVILVLIVHILLLQPQSNAGDVFLYAASVASALFMGIMSLTYLDLMIIVGSAIDGAAIAMYALLHFFGAQPDIRGQVSSGEGSVLLTLVYAVGVIAISSYGIFVQLRTAAADHPPKLRSEYESQSPPEDEALIATYGSVDQEFAKHSLGAPPLLSYDEETGGQG